MRNLFMLIINRIIKIFANLIKIACYIFHFLSPNKRFILPNYSQAIYKKNDQSIIPKIIWQTNFTNRVTLAIYINYLFNRLMSPTYEYRFMITEDRATFIKSNYPPNIYENYSKIQIGAAQADFWRLLVLQKNGGVYLDIDAQIVWPLHLTVKSEYEELYLLRKRGGFTNYFIASKKDNINLEKMISIVLTNIEENTIKNVYELTGPGVLNKVLENVDVNAVSYRYTFNQGNFTNEFFQYIDKPQGKWTKEQKKIEIIKK